jgi:hypothetical protein
MSTSTIQKITDNLLKQAEDKKSQLNETYRVQSVWLQNELETVRGLIANSSKGMSQAAIDSGSIVPPPSQQLLQLKQQQLQQQEEQKQPEQQPQQYEESTRSSGEQGRTKRKGPEADIHGIVSPDAKRSSADNADNTRHEDSLTMEQLFAAAGLPTDLNRLKKEQLLAELISRQVTKYTMRANKGELVNALRECILSSAQATRLRKVETISSSSAMPLELTGHADDGPTTATAAASRSSLLQTLRKSVTSVIETEGDRSARIQNEFEARQRRHRDSQPAALRGPLENPDPTSPPKNLLLRESVASTVYSTVLSDDSNDNETVHHANDTDDVRTVTDIDVDIVRAESVDIDEDTQDAEGSRNPVSPADVLEDGEIEDSDPAPDTWMEVASPGPASCTSASKSFADRQPDDGNSTTVLIPNMLAFVESHTASIVQGSANTVALAKKPSNILTGTTSFLDSKPTVQPKVVSKPVVVSTCER